MRKWALCILVLSVISASVVFINCVSSTPIQPDNGTNSFDNSGFIYGHAPALNTDIDICGFAPKNKTITILETNSSNLTVIVKEKQEPGVSFQESNGYLRIPVWLVPDANNSADVVLYLPDNARYNISQEYSRDDPAIPVSNATIRLGTFTGPIVINIDGNTVVDKGGKTIEEKGRATPTPEPGINLSDPTRMNILAEKDKLLVGGESEAITVQLYYRGEPLGKKGVNVTFTTDNNAIATIYGYDYNVTDASGSTRVFLGSNATPGRVKVTASYNGSNGAISNSTYIDVLRWGNIGGIVFDMNGAGIPNANVSVWTCHYNGSAGKWEKDTILEIPENPQLTNDGRTGAIGQFAFYRVPVGNYTVMAEKDGHVNSSIVTVEPGTATCFLNLSDAFPLMPEKPMDIPAPTLNGGTIWGIACDQDKVGVPNANVSLWYCEINRSTGQWEKTTMVDIPDNPQIASDGKSKPVGEYRFDNVPHGIYYVLANDYEYGFSYYAVIHLNTNLATAYIVLPAPGCRFPIPQPSSAPSPTAVP